MLDVLQRPNLRTLEGISWRDRVTNDEVMRREGMEQLQDRVAVMRRHLAGHILRLSIERPASTAMYWVLAEDGRRKREQDMVQHIS